MHIVINQSTLQIYVVIHFKENFKNLKTSKIGLSVLVLFCYVAISIK